MAAEANDADSFYTQVKLKDAPRLLMLPATDAPQLGWGSPVIVQLTGPRSMTEWFLRNPSARPPVGKIAVGTTRGRTHYCKNIAKNVKSWECLYL